MDEIIERCAGLDVHQATVVACVLVPGRRRRAEKEVRSFRTMTKDLMALRDWLTERGVTHVGMESTGIYWVPVYRVLEGHFELIVGNASHIKNVPGRKTDVKDSEWIADLVRHGLIRRSFVPPPAIRELRELTRFRRKKSQGQATVRNRIQKRLERAGIKLASVASDVFGVSGRAMLAALVDGTTDPATLAQMAKGTLRRKIPDLVDAMTGTFDDEHRFILRLELRELAAAEAVLAEIDVQINRKLAPYEGLMTLLCRIPGVDRVLAASMLAELGPDMTVFPSARHVAAWAGVSPGNNESGGRRRPSIARKGNVHLVTTLVQAASGASRQKGTYLKDKYWRLRVRRGAMRALVAIAHKILIAAYHMLRDGKDYADLGEAYLRQRTAPSKRKLVRELEALGYKVTLEAAPT
jgi:transposase